MADNDAQNFTVLVLTVAVLFYTLHVGDIHAGLPAAACMFMTFLLAANAAPLINFVSQMSWLAKFSSLSILTMFALVVLFIRIFPQQRNTQRRVAAKKTSSARPSLRFASTQDADWCRLPGTAMTLVLRRLSQSDICAVRRVSKDWFNAATECLEKLKPNAFHPAHLMKDFPLIRHLDLSDCVDEVTAEGMVFVTFLHQLSDLSLGRHHNLIASTVDDRCLLQLSCLKKMQRLNLAQCVHVTDRGLYFLAQSLPILEAINISGCVSVTDAGVAVLARISTLRSLEMPWCLKISDLGLRALTVQPKLKRLDISGCQRITEAGICLLANFPELESLNLLNLGYSKVCATDAAIQCLSGLIELKELSIGNIQIQNAGMTDGGVYIIANSFPKLHRLCLMCLNISNDAVNALSKLKQLTALCLKGCSRVTVDAISHIAQMVRLQELDLQSNPWLEMNDDVLEALTPLKELEKLCLGDPQGRHILSDNGVATLAGFKQLKALQLSVFEWQFAGSGLGPLLKLHLLESLDLSNNLNVGDPTLQIIGGLQNVKSLQLNRCNRISSNGLKHLVNTKLNSVSLIACFRIDDRGLASLSEISTLTSLNLSQCLAITDIGLAQLKQCPKLKNLDVSQCHEIRGDGFEGFSEIPLSTLNVSGCSYLHDGSMMHIGYIGSLAKLDMCGCASVTDMGMTALKESSNLTGVDISGCYRMGDATIDVLSHLPRLTTLKVNQCDAVTDYGMGHLMRLPGLLTAHFDRCQNITDQSLVHLGNCTSLTSLRLARCARITDAGVAHIAKLNQLSILNLAQCPFVTGNGIRSLAPLTALASLEY